MKQWRIILNNREWRTISQLNRPPMNQLLELIDRDRTQAETNLDQEFRLDLGIEIQVIEEI